MPGRKCSVNCCKNNSIENKRDGIIKSYFSFPRDENLRNKWINACHNTIDNMATARVCSDHFKDEDFMHNKKSDIPEETRKKRLKLDVVPSLNLYVNARSEESLKRNSSVLTSDRENAKEPTKKKRTKKIDQNFLEQTRRSSSGNLNKENTKKSIPEIDEDLNQCIKNKVNKGISNKENTKGLIKTKINIKSIPGTLRDLPKHKNVKGGDKKSSQELTKQKNRKIKSNGDLKTTPKHKIFKENVKEVIKKKSNSPHEKDSLKNKIFQGNNDKNQPIKQNSSNKNCIELSKDLSKKITGVKSINKGNPRQLSMRKDSLERDYEHSNVIQKQKIAVVILNKDVKKLTKRKNSVVNGFPKRLSRKRIRLGRSDSEDSEESSDRQNSVESKNYENRMASNRITYNNLSEMKDNVDLLKYLNYLKEKSRPTDQPILFWVDD